MQENIIYSLSEENIKKVFENLVDVGLLTTNGISVLYSLFLDVLKETNNEEKVFKEKIIIYQEIWNNTLNTLYKKYLPREAKDKKYKNTFELTPFTYYFVIISGIDFTELIKLDDDDISYIKSQFDLFGLEKYEFYKAKDVSMFDTVDKIISFTIGIMLFPPLVELYIFYNNAYSHHANLFKKLYETVNNVEIEIQGFTANFGLHMASKFISTETYKKNGGIDGLINNPDLTEISHELSLIKGDLPEKMNLQHNNMCPCCGGFSDAISIDIDVLAYNCILRTPKINSFIGFTFFAEYSADLIHEFNKIFGNLYDTINVVKQARCIILVEGRTEEIAVPALAIKCNKPLSVKNIKVINSGSKEKVLADFKKYRHNFPKLKICVLLDSDAVKEKKEFEKLIEGHKDKFYLAYIGKGTFEDLIPLNIIIKTVNNLYPMNKPICESDIDTNTDIVKQIDKLIWKESNSHLDKVEFISSAIKLMDKDNIPELLKELIDVAYKFILIDN